MSRGLAFARAIGWKWSPAPIDGETADDAAVSDGFAPGIVARAIQDAAAGVVPDSAAAAESPGLLRMPGTPTEIATIEDPRTSVTTAAITAIEADIASLLATMNTVSDAAPAAVEEADLDGIDADDATLTLLGELDRLWRADPMVVASDAA